MLSVNNIMDSKHIALGIGILLIGLAAGYFWQSKNTGGTPAPLVPEIVEVFSISGKIKEIRGKAITVEGREIIIASETKIQEGQFKTPDQIVTELREYQKSAAKNNIAPPSSLLTLGRVLSINDLRKGDTVIVEADENIKEKVLFTAKNILVIPKQ